MNEQTTECVVDSARGKYQRGSNAIIAGTGMFVHAGRIRDDVSKRIPERRGDVICDLVKTRRESERAA